MSFVDSLMDMLKNGKEDDGAATARNNLSQTWDYPSLVAALPYRYYDDRNEIFVNAGSAGFIMEAAPLPGANEQVMAALDDMLRKKLPRQTPVTVIMLASKCVGERIDRGVSNDMWKGGMAEHLNKITRAFWQRSALHGLANEREYPLYLRNYRIFIVYGQPIKRASQVQRVMDDLIQIRNTIRVSLGAARIDSMNTDVHAFLSAVREQMNYRQEQVLTSSGDYNEDEKLNRQVVDPGIDLKVHPSHIRMALPETIDARGTRLPASACRIINMQLAKNPRRFALWQGADNLQNIQLAAGPQKDTNNPASPIQICSYGVFYRIGLAIGFWEPMAMVDVTREPGVMVNMGGFKIDLGRTGTGTAGQSDRPAAGTFYHVHWYKYPLIFWLNIITSLGCLQTGDMDIAYLSEVDPLWNDSTLSMLINPEAALFGNLIAQGACAADAVASSAGLPLGRDGVEIEARQPVWLDSKTRRMPGSYRPGMVLEDRTDAKARKSYVIDRVHEDTRVLSLIDGDGVLTRMKIGDISADWRLFSRETLSVATGEKLLAVAGDREHSLKAKDRLEVTGISEKGIEVKRGEETLTLPKDQPLYLSHAYVTAPGGRDNDTGVVLAALNSRDISTQTMNSLAQSGHRAEVFTAEVQDRAEARLQRMKISASPVQLVRNLSGHDDVSQAVDSLHDSVRTDAGLAVWRAINDQRTVVISELKLATEAQKYHPDLEAIGNEIGAMIKNGELLSVSAGGEPVLVSRSTWEMEKAILRVVEEGKGTQQPLLEQVPEAVLNGLTDGQKKATTLVLGTKDQFIGIQGYAGVGKTTQLKAVISALETLPADVRPVMTGLAPTHQAVKEMSDVGVRAQTIKSFIVEHDQATAAGGKPDYKGQVFLIDESSMAGNQDTAALFQAIASGGGRAVSMGDIDQFESVDVGAPFKLMQERSPMDVAIMKQIVRQKDLQLRGAVHDIIDNRIDAALQRIETQPADRVARSASASLPGSAIQETETPVNDIVADWTDRTPEARSRTLIITQLNADRRAVNAGIHAVLAARGELGEKAITVPVLDKITHTRHEFNKTDAWEAGMVVKRGDRYQDVLAVDRNGSTVTVRDEEGKIGLYSPKELITGDVQLFRRSEREVRAGDLLKFTATDKEQGQMASQRYTVESVSETGNIRLKGENGRITINPQAVRAQQHIDYGWAVTGYGAQGASSDYVIALEGTEGGRKALASRRAFYISASRVKEHVQIYTDGKADWVKAVKTPERDIKTAHDALAPETQRKQAKAIWAMGQPVNKTAIGRAWVRHQGMQDASLTAKIIPATRRFPEPALALPVYDNNGRSAGLALVSLVASPEGRMTQGETRMVMTERARGAVLQRSQSGNTIVASDLTAALDAVRNHPKDGVVWQTSDEPPSAYLLKVSGGSLRREEEGLAQRINAKESDILLSAKAERNETASETVDLKAALAQEEARRQQQEPLISKALLQENATKDVEEKFMYTDPDVIHIRPDMLTDSDGTESIKPDSRVLKQIAASDSNAASEAGRELRHESQPETARSGKEQHAASLIVNQLANSERDIVRQPDAGERGRMPEHDEQTLSRTIQKER